MVSYFKTFNYPLSLWILSFHTLLGRSIAALNVNVAISLNS